MIKKIKRLLTKKKRKNEKLIEFLIRWEGFRKKPYRCPAGVRTIGIGFTKDFFDDLGIAFPNKLTKELAKDLLDLHIKQIDDKFKKDFRYLNDNERDAIISFIFNVGETNYYKSTLRRKMLEFVDGEEIEHEFLRWVYAKGKRLRGLENRRRAEAKLFIKGVYAS